MQEPLSREQVEKIVKSFDAIYPWKHELRYLLDTDAALRAEIADLLAKLKAIEDTVGEENYSLRAQLAQVEHEKVERQHDVAFWQQKHYEANQQIAQAQGVVMMLSRKQEGSADFDPKQWCSKPPKQEEPC